MKAGQFNTSDELNKFGKNLSSVIYILHHPESTCGTMLPGRNGSHLKDMSCQNKAHLENTKIGSCLYTEPFLNNTVKDTDSCTACHEHFDEPRFVLLQRDAHSLPSLFRTVLLYYIDFCTAIVQETDSASAIVDFVKAEAAAWRLSQHADK